MILVWVMSLLLYLGWAITQLESILAFEIRSQAVQRTHQSKFMQNETRLMMCEDWVKGSLSSDFAEEIAQAPFHFDCQVRRISRSSNPQIPKMFQASPVDWIEIEVGQDPRLKGLYRYALIGKQLVRVNWQVQHD